MAAAFTKSDGDIAVTLAALFEAPGFAPTLGTKFKDPMHYVVSAVRLAYDERPIQNTAPMLGWLGRLGELPYNRQTPDGYPLDESAWASPGQMATRFEIARIVGSGSAGLFRPEGASADAPAFPRLASAFYYASVEPTLGPGHSRRARARDLAAGMEHPLPVVARVHAALKAQRLHPDARQGARHATP